MTKTKQSKISKIGINYQKAVFFVIPAPNLAATLTLKLWKSTALKAGREIVSGRTAEDDDGGMKTGQSGGLKGAESCHLDSAGSGPAG